VVGLLHRVGWIGLTVVAGFLLFAVGDLRADNATGIPVDHAGAFSALAGESFGAVQQTGPGVARYVLFLALVVIPVRGRQRWAWWACWAVGIATAGYTFTIARHDPAVLGRSLIADVAVPVLLLMCAPAVFTRTPPGPHRAAATGDPGDRA
jgi:hypothetical protein